MTDEEKKRVLQMLFSEIRADHTANGLSIEFKARPIWEPYVGAVLVRQRQVVTNRRLLSLRSGRQDSMSPSLKRPGWSVTNAGG